MTLYSHYNREKPKYREVVLLTQGCIPDKRESQNLDRMPPTTETACLLKLSKRFPFSVFKILNVGTMYLLFFLPIPSKSLDPFLEDHQKLIAIAHLNLFVNYLNY